MGMIWRSGGRSFCLRDRDGGKGICDDAGCGKGGTLYPILSEKTGIYGMIGGQTVDVELTNQRSEG